MPMEKTIKNSLYPASYWYAVCQSKENCHHQHRAWPTGSSHMCWYCARRFSDIPCLLPVTRKNKCFHCIGNFCSWNCVKAYGHKMNNRPKDCLAYISLLAYWTAIKPQICPVYNAEKHPANCICLTKVHTPIKVAPPPVILDQFGGAVTSQEYSKGFTTIKNYDWITAKFSSSAQVLSQRWTMAWRKFPLESFNPTEEAKEAEPMPEVKAKYSYRPLF